LLWLRLEGLLLLLLLHDDGMHDAMYGWVPKVLGHLRQLLATLLSHHLAAALLQDP
jgi:hypothetical protein